MNWAEIEADIKNGVTSAETAFTNLFASVKPEFITLEAKLASYVNLANFKAEYDALKARVEAEEAKIFGTTPPAPPAPPAAQ